MIRFFKPKPNFWDWLEQHRGRIIVDVGCGRGELVKEMLDRGYRAVGIEPRLDIWSDALPLELLTNIIPMQAEQVPEVFNHPETTILCCRPCHSGFPGNVAAMKSDGVEMFYVGFEQNLDRDVGADEFVITPMLRDVGKDNENLYQIA